MPGFLHARRWRFVHEPFAIGRRIGVVNPDEVLRHRTEIARPPQFEQGRARARPVDALGAAVALELIVMSRSEVDAEAGAAGRIGDRRMQMRA